MRVLASVRCKLTLLTRASGIQSAAWLMRRRMAWCAFLRVHVALERTSPKVPSAVWRMRPGVNR